MQQKLHMAVMYLEVSIGSHPRRLENRRFASLDEDFRAGLLRNTVPINNVAAVKLSDARSIVIKSSDKKSTSKVIEKAIIDSSLGINARKITVKSSRIGTHR